LTTVGRRSGLPRVTPLLYDEIDGIVYVASARGAKADWYQNLQANPNVEVVIGSRRLRGCADLITDPLHVTDFLEKRLKLHPILTSSVMRVGITAYDSVHAAPLLSGLVFQLPV
jgi:deazaflavin-dependent oxidoreductase (nitroreductase family)